MVTNDGRCTCEIKSSISMEKGAFDKKKKKKKKMMMMMKKKTLFTRKLDLKTKTEDRVQVTERREGIRK
jgi:hypothetical protein